MGIPHLLTYLRPYAIPTTLTSKDLIIDGPSFAYHIYFLCLRQRASAHNALEILPSYREIGEASICFLNALTASGVFIRKLYFDGFLPASKRPTRLERLTASSQKILSYFQTKPLKDFALGAPIDVQITPFSIFSVRSLASSKLGSLASPAASFLVPAVIEALLSSKDYRNLVEVIPGEADTFCASYVKTHGGVIFTSDSDLLVHDVGENGAIAYFQDLSVDFSISGKDGTAHVKCHVLHPQAISKRLGLPKPKDVGGVTQPRDLCALAFEILKEPHLSFPQVVVRAMDMKSAKEMPEEWEEFLKEYKPSSSELPVEAAREDITSSKGVSETLQHLDPRISEFVLQHPVMQSRSTAPTSQDDAATEISMFLPLMLECPTQTTVWEASLAPRLLAYSALNLIVSEYHRLGEVAEFRRYTFNSKEHRGKKCTLPLSSEWPGLAQEMLDLIVKVKAKLSPSFSVWHVLAICHDLQCAEESGKNSITARATEKTKRPKNNTDPTETWRKLHFIALLQSSFYSFRMLSQMLDIVIALGSSDTANPFAKLPEVLVFELRKQLDELPRLREVLSVPDMMREFEDGERIEEMVKFAEEVRGSDGGGNATEEWNDDNEARRQVEASEKKEKKEKKKKRKAGGEGDEENGVAKKRGNNMFDLLGEE